METTPDDLLIKKKLACTLESTEFSVFIEEFFDEIESKVFIKHALNILQEAPHVILESYKHSVQFGETIYSMSISRLGEIVLYKGDDDLWVFKTYPHEPEFVTSFDNLPSYLREFVV